MQYFPFCAYSRHQSMLTQKNVGVPISSDPEISKLQVHCLKKSRTTSPKIPTAFFMVENCQGER